MSGWKCSQCTFINDCKSLKCEICGISTNNNQSSLSIEILNENEYKEYSHDTNSQLSNHDSASNNVTVSNDNNFNQSILVSEDPNDNLIESTYGSYNTNKMNQFGYHLKQFIVGQTYSSYSMSSNQMNCVYQNAIFQISDSNKLALTNMQILRQYAKTMLHHMKSKNESKLIHYTYSNSNFWNNAIKYLQKNSYFYRGLMNNEIDFKYLQHYHLNNYKTFCEECVTLGVSPFPKTINSVFPSLIKQFTDLNELHKYGRFIIMGFTFCLHDENVIAYGDSHIDNVFTGYNCIMFNFGYDDDNGKYNIYMHGKGLNKNGTLYHTTMNIGDVYCMGGTNMIFSTHAYQSIIGNGSFRIMVNGFWTEDLKNCDFIINKYITNKNIPTNTILDDILKIEIPMNTTPNERNIKHPNLKITHFGSSMLLLKTLNQWNKQWKLNEDDGDIDYSQCVNYKNVDALFNENPRIQSKILTWDITKLMGVLCSNTADEYELLDYPNQRCRLKCDSIQIKSLVP